MKGFPYITFGMALNGFGVGAALGGHLHMDLMGLICLAAFFAFFGAFMAETLGTALMVRHIFAAQLEIIRGMRPPKP